MNLSKYITLFLTVFFLNGCSTIKDNLSLKKKTNVDQFLVDKKDPLVLPPDFDELPLPTSLTTQEIEAEEKDEKVFLDTEPVIFGMIEKDLWLGDSGV